MDTELIKRLVDETNQKGSAKYRTYVLTKNEQGYQLTMNKKPMVNFVITGYEQGYLEENMAKTDYQINTVANLQAFLTGQY
ncbi:MULTISPECIES: hypothetical protein [unclassified Lactococcus]|uniref:hypothetical protein n=1 Tax=unclassified Lactococcus TaxID=2643510 RepID=UPI0011C6F4FB|nr:MULTISPECIES: hypothetical protein [unclassified Lactococcus]MQW23321.1 hypothetical protein [Lactococcus sp. dk101]TXK37977.1 hypothetical protein FVP42_07265 [Lactococcus sp. dk310]TXK49631.1 hypothetical protein FVP43_07235 [Lactococcus sp. dk322]